MPGMDGKEAAQRIREYEKEHGLYKCVILIVSGNCSASEEEECLNPEGKIRAQGFLRKPVSLEEMANFVRSKGMR